MSCESFVGKKLSHLSYKRRRASGLQRNCNLVLVNCMQASDETTHCYDRIKCPQVPPSAPNPVVNLDLQRVLTKRKRSNQIAVLDQPARMLRLQAWIAGASLTCMER